MIQQLTANNFELLTFYSYTSTIPAQDRIDSISDMDDLDIPRMKRKFDHMSLFYDALALKASEITGVKSDVITFRDNKTVYKLKYKGSDAIIYVGYYDGNYVLGLGVHQYFGREYDFSTKTWSEYKNEEDYN